MFWNNGQYTDGYTKGGIDVITGVNLFFKFLLLSPIFLLAGIVFVTMFKHVIYHGVPTMSVPTQEQREQLQRRNEAIGIEQAPPKPIVQPQASAPPAVIPALPTTPSPEVVQATQARIDQEWESARFRDFCITSWLPRYGDNANASQDPCMEFKN